MRGEKILITGPAGQVAFPVARELAKTNDVWGIARFGTLRIESVLRRWIWDVIRSTSYLTILRTC